MKIKHSNIIFFSYLGLIFLVILGILIYARVLLNNGDLIQQKDVKIDLNNTNFKSVPSFDVVYLKNVDLIDMFQTDSFAVEIPDSSMILRNDTLFVENCNSAVLLYESISEVICENAEFNLVSNNGEILKIESSNSDVNLAVVDLSKLILISKGDSEINLICSNINTLELDFSGRNEVSIVGSIEVLQGNNSNETSINVMPKPKKVNLIGNTKLN